MVAVAAALLDFQQDHFRAVQAHRVLLLLRSFIDESLHFTP